MTHFYEPRLGHQLKHDPFNAIVGPRPIGWISSQSADGVLNLAPYSFFNAFNYVPPLIGFSSIGRKDSLNNIEATGEFAGLTTAPSTLVKVPRVAQSPVSFECRCTQIMQMKNLQGESIQTWMIFGEVIGVHIEERLISTGIYDTANAQHVLRAGGPADYFSIGPEQLFKLYRPQ